MENLEKKLIDTVLQNPEINDLLNKGEQLGLKDWYVGAGGIAQTIWNCLTGRELNEKIKDYDFVYYDATDLSERCEDRLYNLLNAGENVDVKNQAKVHLRYHKHFAKQIEQYATLESAIDTWPTTATSVGIRKEGDKYKIYAPYGLEDMFGMIVKPNKKLISRDVYEKKVAERTAKRPELTIIPW